VTFKVFWALKRQLSDINMVLYKLYRIPSLFKPAERCRRSGYRNNMPQHSISLLVAEYSALYHKHI